MPTQNGAPRRLIHNGAPAVSRRAAMWAFGATTAFVGTPFPGHAETPVNPSDLDRNKAMIASFIDVVWRHGRLDELPRFWTSDCVNHADAAAANRGLSALRSYHEQFGKAFAGFSAPTIDIIQQVAEADRVVTHMVTRAMHAASGKPVSLATIRIDRLQAGKIAEHWSVADMAGLMQQLQP